MVGRDGNEQEGLEECIKAVFTAALLVKLIELDQMQLS